MYSRIHDKVSEIANLIGHAQQSTRSRSSWTKAKGSADVQAVVERLLRSTIVFQPLHALLLTPSPSLLDFVDGCARHPDKPTSFTLCPAQRSADTFTRLSLCGAILKYTTITDLFL